MALNVAQERTYASEAEENFRWLSSLLATKSSHTLSSSDLVDDELRLRLSEIGQYAEMAHGSISPSFVFQHLGELCQPGYPLEEYDALKRDGAQLVSHFRGTVADVQGYTVFRPGARQLVVAFSGTSSPAQAFKDMQTWRTAYPRDAKRSTVHAGFWKMYQGARNRAFEALRAGFQEHGGEIDGVVLTGHSMGCTLCYLFALDLLAEFGEEASAIPLDIQITLALFGSPRVGNEGLAMYWRRCVERHRNEFGESSFNEYSVKGYNDGVHTLPPRSLGFRHLTEAPLFFYHGGLYHIPTSESEHGAFTVELRPSSPHQEPKGPDPSPPFLVVPSTEHQFPHIKWPRGGHNYYNDRDMENTQRRMRWLDVALHGEEGWRERYMNGLKIWETKWGKVAEEYRQ